MMKLLSGPLLRQLMQFVSGGLLTAGVMTSDEWMQISGGASSVVTAGLVVYARIKAAKAEAELLELAAAAQTLKQKSAAASAIRAQRRLP